MKITRLKITIEPWQVHDFRKVLRVEIIMNGTQYTSLVSYEEDDLVSRFDYLMERSRREILKLIKAPGVKPSNDWVVVEQLKIKKN